MATLMPVEKEDMSEDETASLKLTKETDKAKASRMAKAWETVLADPSGRAVLWDIISRAGIMQTPAVFGDTHRTYHNIGRADFGRELYASVASAYPARLLQMEKENMR